MLWEFSIDVGGTFTDCLATAPSGEVHRFKLLSSGVVRGRARYEGQGRFVDEQRDGELAGVWAGYTIRAGEQLVEGTLIASHGSELVCDAEFEFNRGKAISYELSSGEEAPVVAIRYLLGLGKADPIPDVVVRLGTTRGTNALLTRQGATVGLVTTKGFGDAPLIGNQSRPRLFELGIQKPVPLFVRGLEVDERVGFAGDILSPLDEAELRRGLQQLLTDGIRSLAVCLINSYRFPQHEKTVGRIALELGFEEVSLSHQVSPLVKLIDRADTTLVNAYLNPVLQDYVERIASALSDRSQLRMLTSAGGLVAADRFAGKDSILSGPAGGVVGRLPTRQVLSARSALIWAEPAQTSRVSTASMPFRTKPTRRACAS